MELTRVTERERGIWRAALTLANNVCVQESDRHNADDETREANTANELAKRLRGFIEADDKQLVELFAEAGVPDNGPDPLCEALNSGDGSYRRRAPGPSNSTAAHGTRQRRHSPD